MSTCLGLFDTWVAKYGVLENFARFRIYPDRNWVTFIDGNRTLTIQDREEFADLIKLEEKVRKFYVGEYE